MFPFNNVHREIAANPVILGLILMLVGFILMMLVIHARDNLQPLRACQLQPERLKT